MKSTFLVIKGNFTQRQFDALGQIWNTIQKEQGLEKSCPLLQLAGSEGDLGFMTIDLENNEFKTGSVFSLLESSDFNKEEFMDKLKEVLK